MSNGINRFVSFWRKLDLSASHGQFVHPDDIPHMTPEATNGLALHLLPLGVNGSLKSADVVILMLNSGFGDCDVLWETSHPKEHQVMLASQRANLHQSHCSEDHYPFYDLNPLFRDHPGAAYWKGGANLAVAKRQDKKLASIAAELGNVWNASSETVYRELSNRVAVIELLSYRSTKFKHKGLFRKLPSCAEALKLVSALIAENEKLIVIPRSVMDWGFSGPNDDTENLIVYDPSQGAAASITTRSAGGKAILDRLKPNKPEQGANRAEADRATSVTPLKRINISRGSELFEIYAKSGLQELVDFKHPMRYFEKPNFTKLLFVRNDFGIRSIELWDLKRGGSYFRIHHRDTAPTWMAETMKSWPSIRSSDSFGMSFDGDPLVPATLMANLLRLKR